MHKRHTMLFSLLRSQGAYSTSSLCTFAMRKMMIDRHCIPSECVPIYEKVCNGERLSIEEGLFLFSTPHLHALQQMAEIARQRKAQNIVYYALTLYIHPTNLCELSCPMCSFYAKPGWSTAWLLSPQEIENKVREAIPSGITEVHIVGGLWRECSLEYYEEVFHRIRSLDPDIHIKALTAVEYDFLSKIHNLSIDEVLLRLQRAGLGSITGGGAEILVEEIRTKIAPQKLSTEEYLSIHKKAHMAGIPSNVTMLFGHIEDPIHILQHLVRVRELQDQTDGFQSFVPLKYHDENNALGKSCRDLKPKDIRRIYAISRLMLDSVRNIKVVWKYVGLDEAKNALSWGCNDISSTSTGEKIVSMAGGLQHDVSEQLLHDLIREAGKIPKKIHSGHLYDT